MSKEGVSSEAELQERKRRRAAMSEGLAKPLADAIAKSTASVDEARAQARSKRTSLLLKFTSEVDELERDAAGGPDVAERVTAVRGRLRARLAPDNAAAQDGELADARALFARLDVLSPPPPAVEEPPVVEAPADSTVEAVAPPEEAAAAETVSADPAGPRAGAEPIVPVHSHTADAPETPDDADEPATPAEAPYVPAVGHHVAARWQDGVFYGATVRQVDGERFEVEWDDGSEKMWVSAEDVRGGRSSGKDIVLGQRVEARWQDGNFYEATVVTIGEAEIEVSWADSSGTQWVASNLVRRKELEPAAALDALEIPSDAEELKRVFFTLVAKIDFEDDAEYARKLIAKLSAFVGSWKASHTARADFQTVLKLLEDEIAKARAAEAAHAEASRRTNMQVLVVSVVILVLAFGFIMFQNAS